MNNLYDFYLFFYEVYAEYHPLPLVSFVLWFMAKLNNLLYYCLLITLYFEMFVTFDQFQEVDGFDSLDRVLFAYGQF